MPGSTYGEEGSGAETIYMILTWLGIFVTLAVLVAWVVYENRQLVRHVARLRRSEDRTQRTTASAARRSGRHAMINNGQRQAADRVPRPCRLTSRASSSAMLAISILCVQSWSW